MDVAVITGSAGLVGSAAARAFTAEGYTVVGIDNDQRARFFGDEASTAWNRAELERSLPGYTHHDADIRDVQALERIFGRYGRDVRCVIHAAAQPSHDWAARAPVIDFDVNARATLLLLEQVRERCPDARFVFTSTNKVYGDAPNRLPLQERETRWELAEDHPYFAHGIPETLSVDQCLHSLFGTSKLAADAMVQEYGRYFGMNTVCFRAGCITGAAHSGTALHGFLSYLVRCALEGREYTVIGYGGKQVRDNIHATDLARMFVAYCGAPRPGEVYNAGGGRASHSSLREAVTLVERIAGRALATRYDEDARTGDHVWYVSDTRKFASHYPGWRLEYDLEAIVTELVERWSGRGP